MSPSPPATDVALRPTQVPALVPRRVQPVVSAFQPDAIELEERNPPRLARMAFYLAVALLVCVVVWASVSRMDEVVSAQGKLITTRPTLIIQPLETAVVREMNVAVGDTVTAGQALVTLDPTMPEADVRELRTRHAALLAQTDRLEAELAGRVYVAAPDADADAVLQASLAADRRAYYAASLRNYDEQLGRVQGSIASNRLEQEVAAQRLATLAQIEQMRGTLLNQQEGSRLNLLLSQDARLEVEANLKHLRGAETEMAHELQKLAAERQAFAEDFRRTTSEQLVEARAKRDSAAEQLKKADLRRRMIVLTAPTDGTVLEVAQRSAGSVVRESETLVSIVPRDVPLEADVTVQARDVGHIAPGQSARVKFDAFPFQKYGTVAGTVRLVSEGSFTPEERGAAREAAPIFRIRVRLSDQRLRGLAPDVRMLPGMTVSAEVVVGRRSVISYFLYPLLRGLDESIREP